MANKPAAWLAVHLALSLVLTWSWFFYGPFRIQADLAELLPQPSRVGRSGNELAAVEKAWTLRDAGDLRILAGHPDLAVAKKKVSGIRDRLAASGVFQRLDLEIQPLEGLLVHLHHYRYLLLGPEERALLEAGRAGNLAAEALALAFGPISLPGLEYLEDDPFLLTQRAMRGLLSSGLQSGLLSLQEGVLAGRLEGKWYVQLQGSLAPEAASLSGAGVLAEIRTFCAGLESDDSELTVVYSGPPFHSQAAAAAAEREVSLISVVSLGLIALLFLLIYRSLLPILATLAMIACSILAAAGAVLAFFHEIHLLTFVFGTTLIGISIDYSIHHFAHQREGAGLEERAGARRAMLLCLLSSEICFIAVFFAPFSILKQFALFTAVGLLSSFLSVNCLFPCLPSGPADLGGRVRRLLSRLPGSVSRRKIALLLILPALLCLAAQWEGLRVENRLDQLYHMPADLLESERLASRLAGSPGMGGYFILSGRDREELLEKEETLAGLAGGGLAGALLTPSLRSQRDSRAAAERLLPLAGEQYAHLGFPPEKAVGLQEDFAKAAGVFLSPDQPPEFLRPLLDKLYFGQAASGRHYSRLLPLSRDEDFLRALAADMEGVFFVHRAKDSSLALDSLSRIMLRLFAVAGVLALLLILKVYARQAASRLCAALLLLALYALALLSVLGGLPLSFFSVVGLALIFGLGLDYLLHLEEGGAGLNPEGRQAALLAVTLSYCTTALSFGVLALTSFPPVRIFGLTVLAGVSAAFLVALLLNPSQS
ncbi:MAG: MMPL family transporter [Desulfovibrionaceae bacterium]|nr:MMPL family transporter [Desulfovibrionaceae bacterium]